MVCPVGWGISLILAKLRLVTAGAQMHLSFICNHLLEWILSLQAATEVH